MGTSEKFEPVDLDLAKAKRYIRSSESNSISRPYVKGTHYSMGDTEINSSGLYCFEKMIRLAFIQMMKEDALFGRREDFIDYMIGLSDNFEEVNVSDLQPDQSSARASDFMMSFFTVYSHQWKRRGRSVEESLANFLAIMRECLDFSYMWLSRAFDSSPKGIKNGVDKAFFLTNSRIDDWHTGKVAEISAV
ncbi:MAG: hypothetical protein IBX64_08065 [Actinobacteria bacterium]|nr:hypothetical protein [Actinomycetota bacterium]